MKTTANTHSASFTASTTESTSGPDLNNLDLKREQTHANGDTANSTTAYPTESRMLQKEREKQRVAAGLEKTTFKRYKHVEEHYDDCGDNTNILEEALVSTDAYHADEDSETETAATGISTFMMLESLDERLPKCCSNGKYG